MNSHLLKSARLAFRLEENLKAMKSLHGEKWPEVMADLGTALQLDMKATGQTNPLLAALKIAERMDADGKNPLILLAVATELSK